MRLNLEYHPTISIPSHFYLIVDSNEQKPLFEPDERWIVRKKLDVGDYSVAGMENLISIERKSLTDLYHTLGCDRARFEKQLQRMRKLMWKGLVIEAEEGQVLQPQIYSNLSFAQVYHSLASLEVTSFHIYYAANRDKAKEWVLSRLSRFYKYIRGGRI